MYNLILFACLESVSTRTPASGVDTTSDSHFRSGSAASFGSRRQFASAATRRCNHNVDIRSTASHISGNDSLAPTQCWCYSKQPRPSSDTICQECVDAFKSRSRSNTNIIIVLLQLMRGCRTAESSDLRILHTQQRLSPSKNE